MALYTSANTPPEYPNEPLMYPLRIKTGGHPIISQIYAYPSQRPAHTLVQLQTAIPGIVEYVLGPTWRSQLSHLSVLNVPQSNWTNDDENAITLRVLRGGGAIIDHTSVLDRWWVLGDGFANRWLAAEQAQKYIFGWPSSGGVWVLDLPPLLEKHTLGDPDLGEELELHNRMSSGDKAVFRRSDGSIYYGDLIGSQTMDELCERLEEKGAKFYAEIWDSVEVIEVGLWDADAALKKQPSPDPGVIRC